MSSILIAFASHHGQTRKVAVRLGEHLRTLGHDVDLANLADGLTETPSPEDYDVVVLGSRIEISRPAPSLGAYVRDHRAALGEIPTVLFTVSMSAVSTDKGPDPQGYLAKICTDLGWTPSLRKAIAGGLKYREYGFFTRFIMKMISRSAGRTTDTSKNHEFTDWEGVRQFAGEIAALCPHSRVIEISRA
jgi:menaquinone-dependent protoporphyrinogen oxidase